MELRETFQKVKTASKTLSLLSDDQRNDILQAVADAIIAETPALLAANAEDLAKMDKANPLYDRLQLTEQRLQDIASDMRHVSTTWKSSQRQNTRKRIAPAENCRSFRSHRYDL